MISFQEANKIFSEISISLTMEQYDIFSKYAEMLLNESEVQNVTAVKTEIEIWKRHFLDAAFLINELPKTSKIIDIGTGGGVPGIPLAILRPNIDMALLDSELRKIEFCRKVIHNLGLKIRTAAGRAEEISRMPEFEGKFDLVVSRAMAAGSMLTEVSVRYLKVNGRLIAMKGKQYDPTIERFAEAADALGCIVENEKKYTLDNEEKHLIILRKQHETPDQYPRRFAKIKRSPL
ncbi:MAG: 16S rRNA (guanine(527)-N(7))-methyltransferase RsmG [Oscillospiraceae bacterium]|nr:16S rRNA (guanine(527)-N(7))-methyltransferase RsmG [Oscillospiraceae bacterium]